MSWVYPLIGFLFALGPFLVVSWLLVLWGEMPSSREDNAYDLSIYAEEGCD